MDDPERLTAEWLHLHGTPEQRAAYIGMVERRNRMLDEHERSIVELKAALTSVQSDLKDMASDARAARAEQNLMLKEIVGQVQAIVREQTLETGRRQGAEDAHTKADKMAASRGAWGRAMIPFAAAVLGLAAYKWIEGIAIAVRATVP